MSEFLTALLGLAGFALITLGLFMAWEPLGWVAAGGLLVAVAVAVDRDPAVKVEA